MTGWTCRNCKSSRVEKFLSFDRMPLAGAFLPGPEAIKDEQIFTLTVWSCDDCGLVQLEEEIDPDILFRQYNFSTGTIPLLVDHFRDFADFLCGELKAKSIVEFGCNDGTLLTFVEELGGKALGVDIAENITEIAREKGLAVETGYFNEDMAENIAAKFGRADIVCGSNCFAHNPDTRPILRAAKMLLRDEGSLVLEVMYAGDLLDKLQWDTLYHEHMVVYSLKSLQTLLGDEGFTIVDVFWLPMHAGSLRVVARPNANAKPGPRVVDLMAREEATALNRSATWAAFGERIDKCLTDVSKSLGEIAENNSIWAYGASGRASMWFNACGMDYVEKVIDASQLRAGRLMPGLHQPIVPPESLRENPPDCMLVTAWNYFEQIRAKEPGYNGVWVTPLPTLTFY
ncbi:MAG: class I SAM-dependent methyltransferase [Rhodospirillales bacterium]|nr:class I SAM-dependent methyltransferase [Rhodospirillales bacterium]